MTVALATGPGNLREVPERQRQALARMGIEGSERAAPVAELEALLRDADLVLDALIGYSLRGAPRGPIASMIRAANEAPGPRLSLDLPSGLDGDTGKALEPTLRAEATLTPAWPKAGLLDRTAQPFVGDLYLADISVPAPVYRTVGMEPGTLFSRGPIVRIRRLEGGWKPLANSEELE